MTSDQTKNTPPRHRATVWIVTILLLFALAITALGVWHSGALLSQFAVLRSANGSVDAAIYTVCYYDTLAELSEGEYTDLHVQAEATERTEEKLSRALVFFGLAKAEGKLDSYADYASEAGERALASLREAASAKGKSESVYVKSLYGRGIGADDVARTAEFFAVAELRARELAEKIYTAEEREAAFAANSEKLLLADCIVYSVKAKYHANATPDEMRDAYLEAESRAQTVAAATTKADFIAAMQADYRAVNVPTTLDAVNAMTKNAYRYHISAKESDMVARWAFDAARTAGDTAVLGANGDYTVVYCLSPAKKQTGNTANFWQMFIPIPEEDDRDERYFDVLDIFGSLNGVAGYRDRAAQVGDVSLVQNAWRAELPAEVADWLDKSHHAGDSSLIETEEGFYLVCFDSVGELVVWEKQAAGILQEEEYAALLEAAAIRSVDFGRLFLLID